MFLLSRAVFGFKRDDGPVDDVFEMPPLVGGELLRV